jgi:hypothetical protein
MAVAGKVLCSGACPIHTPLARVSHVATARGSVGCVFLWEDCVVPCGETVWSPVGRLCDPLWGGLITANINSLYHVVCALSFFPLNIL